MWIMTSSNDSQSCEAMDNAVAQWKESGVRVNKFTWNVDCSPEEFSNAAKEQAKKKGTIKYTVIDGGNREYTWCIGHRIEEIRDWISSQ